MSQLSPPVQPTVSGTPPGTSRGRRVWLWSGSLLVVIVLTAWALHQFRARQEEVKTPTVAPIRSSRVVTGTVIRTIRVSGQSSARNFKAITVPILKGPESRRDQTLLSLAKAGTIVNAGDTLAELDPANAVDHIDDVKDMVAQAESDIRNRKAQQEVEWVTLEQTMREAKADLDKATWDAKPAEVRTTVERELLKLNAEEAQASHKTMQADLASRKSAQQAELRILDVSLIRQKNHLDRHVVDLQLFHVKAPMKGLVVLQQTWRGAEQGQIQEGDQVSPGQLFMKIVDPSTMQIEGSVNQVESSEFRIGQKATIGLDAFPDLKFRGRVYAIGALAATAGRSGNYIRTVPIRIAIEGSDPRLIPDLSGWAEVEIERREATLTIPVEAVRNERGNDFVYVKRGPKWEKTGVQLGLQNYTKAVVVSGLKAGDEVALEVPK
jgi:HlyD family secretion protein